MPVASLLFSEKLKDQVYIYIYADGTNVTAWRCAQVCSQTIQYSAPVIASEETVNGRQATRYGMCIIARQQSLNKKGQWL